MKRYLAASFIIALSVLLTGENGRAEDACPPSAGVGTGMPGGASNYQAVGMITRATDTEARFAVEPIEGTFRTGDDLAIYTREGELVGKGRVHSIYDDDLYVDAYDAPKNTVAAGFVVMAGYSAGDAAGYFRAMRDALANAASETRKDASRMRQEIADEARRNLSNHEKWQEEMTKMKMQLDYQYPTYYWGGYSYYYR
ncbi:MAG: hypothetical protein WC899_09315 [bacterium]|jgi:hypothetical protein